MNCTRWIASGWTSSGRGKRIPIWRRQLQLLEDFRVIRSNEAQTMALGDILYSDSLVEITDEAILFRHYYFPLGAKRVRFAEIAGISVERPTWLNGKYRIHGSSDLQTWFPLDWHRPSRSRIFFARLRRSSRVIGFTVEDAETVEEILRDKHLLSDENGSYRGG